MAAASHWVHVGWIATVLLAGPHGRAAEVERPRLYFGPQDLPALRERASREPYAKFYHSYRRILDGEVVLPNPELDPVLMETQVGALVWLVSGEKGYAERGKRALLERVRAWDSQIRDYRYETHRSRISLFVSRRLQNLCTDFDLLAASGVFTDEEKAFVRATLAMVASRLMERGTSFNPYDYYSERFRCDNWNTDRFVAVGMYALTFPDHEHSKSWLNHAVEEMAWQLDHVLLPDGAWPEGTRYHGAVLRSMIPFAYALQRNAGVDFFAHPRFKGMLESLIHLLTPPAALADGAALLPGIGDADWENIWAAVLGWSAPAYARIDSAFAGRLMWGWRRAGAPFAVEFSPGNPIVGFLFIDATLEATPQPVLVSDVRPAGYAVLRGGFGTDQESYFLLNVGGPREPFQHQHRDRGSFSLWAGNTPLAIDPGVQDYGESLERWFARSRAHNQVVFADEDAREGGAITDFLSSDWIDYVRADLTRSVGSNYVRDVFFMKPDVYLVWDRVDDAQRAAVYHLHVLTDQDREPTLIASDSDGADRVVSPCLNGLELELAVLSPERAVRAGLLKLDRDPYPLRFHAERQSVPTMVHAQVPWWLRLKQGPTGGDFITLLHARRTGTDAMDLRGLKQTGGAFQIDLQHADRQTAIYLGPRDENGVRLDGEAAVVMRRDGRGTVGALVVNARQFANQDGLNVMWPENRTTAIRKLQDE